MNCRIVIDSKGREFKLNDNEEKVMRALERLEKMNFGRLSIFGNGRLSVRINGCWAENEFDILSIFCEGGDGGD